MIQQRHKILLGVLGICWFGILGFIYVSTNRDIEQITSFQIDKESNFANRALFDAYSCEFPTSITVDDLAMRVVRDTLYGLPPTYVPQDLVIIPPNFTNSTAGVLYVREPILAPLSEMLEAARADGYELFVNSAYRSFDQQQSIYTNPLNSVAVGEFERAAQPGFSEHQLGTTLDISASLFSSASNLQAGYQWLEDNGYKYGFILSYPRGQETVTGFRHEPWHHRYVGPEAATRFTEQGILFNEEESAFLPHPFLETSAPHAFTKDSVYVSLRSNTEELRNDIIYSNFLGVYISEEEMEEVLLRIKEKDSFLVIRPEGNLEFESIRNPLEVDFTQHQRIQARAKLNEDEMIFIDSIEVPYLNATLVFGSKGRVDQMNILESHVLENCR